jgi:hypothetical protein
MNNMRLPAVIVKPYIIHTACNRGIDGRGIGVGIRRLFLLNT